MNDAGAVEIMFQNDQWKIEKENGIVFLQQNIDGRPRITSCGYYIDAAHLATETESGYTELTHIFGKGWVDLDLLEPAVRKAIELSGIEPNYDLDAEFAAARRRRDGTAKRHPALDQMVASLREKLMGAR